jgi:phosphate transport system protein
VVQQLRRVDHGQLEQIDQAVSVGLALVEETLAAASDAFLSADDEAAKAVAARGQQIKAIHSSLEALVFTQLALQAPVGGELRQLIAVLRIVPELDLTVALAGGIARRGGMHFAAELPPRIRGLVNALFERASSMWHQVGDAYIERAPEIHDRLEAEDEEIDELYAGLIAELASGAVRAPVLVEMALVARFLERLGDHAVEVARWIESFTSFEALDTQTT